MGSCHLRESQPGGHAPLGPAAPGVHPPGQGEEVRAVADAGQDVDRPRSGAAGGAAEDLDAGESGRDLDKPAASTMLWIRVRFPSAPGMEDIEDDDGGV